MKLTAARLLASLRKRMSLLEDKAADETIDRELRNGVEMRGTNLWVLMAAIFIASIGLNVNSTAVIIGAMLISPLMGPILGVGYGVGVLDIALVRRSLKNLAIAVGIALATSTLYFLISPLNTVASELLARTKPSIWDVLIALFGGFAGIIGVTRREKSNVIPGVAIATALMPPLCTAGFGIAHGNLSFIGGAFYLFAINCVFIAFSSGVVVRAFHVRQTPYVDAAVAARVRRYVTAVVLATLVPSTYFAYRMVQQELFRARASSFVSAEFDDGPSHVTQTTILPAERRIEVTLIGEWVSLEKQDAMVARLPLRGLAGAQLVLHQARDSAVDVSQLKSSLLSDLYARSQQAIEEKDRLIETLQTAQQEHSVGQRNRLSIAQELAVLFPELQDIVVTEGERADAAPAPAPAPAPAASGVPNKLQGVLAINAVSVRHVNESELARLRNWLQLRAPQSTILVSIALQRPPGPAHQQVPVD